MTKEYNHFKFPIVSHHVGGRAGTRALPLLAHFEFDIISVLYEADETALDQMVKVNSQGKSKTIVLGDCLSGHTGPRDFFIYSNRYISSLYPLLAKYQSIYSYDSNFKFDNDPKGSALVKKITLNTITLDEVIEREEGKVPAPDFLSLDTQGSELEIMQGAKKTITENVIAIITEVSFTPVYENQPLFGDIEKYMRQEGFELVSVNVSEDNYMSNRTPIGLSGLGFSKQADVLFLRTTDSMNNFSDKNLSLLKQAFICFVYNYFDRTYEILLSISDKKIEALISGDSIKDSFYLRFLEKVKTSISSEYPPIFPVKYSDIYNHEEGERRFSTKKGIALDIKRSYQSYLSNLTPEYLEQCLGILETEAFYGVEFISETFGFVQQAKELKRRRLEQVNGVKYWLTHWSSANDKNTL